MQPTIHFCVLTIAAAMALPALGAEPASASSEPWLQPYSGPEYASLIDAKSIEGKLLCGYQGWFNAPGDGTRFGFGHWGDIKGRFGVDMWPDTSEYDAKDLVEVPGVKMPDGSPAKLYSGFMPGPTLIHARWMREYGIDGFFLSRFIGETTGGERTRHVNQNLANVRAAAHKEGRVWAMMLDLSMGKANVDAVKNDWKFLCDKVRIREDSRYLREKGKPVVLLWGLGFNDNSHPYTAEQSEDLINFFQKDPAYGGAYLIGGVDPGWRTLSQGSRKDEAWNKVYRMFDSISVWNTGRYKGLDGVDRMKKGTWGPDVEELNKLGKGYMPNAFPGFSWDNMHNYTPGQSNFPRLKGEFFWKQLVTFKQLGVKTIFVGMFDEVNEGTAIYKVSDTVPAGKYFVTYEGMGNDYYLKLAGAGAKMLRGEMPISEKIPADLPGPKK